MRRLVTLLVLCGALVGCAAAKAPSPQTGLSEPSAKSEASKEGESKEEAGKALLKALRFVGDLAVNVGICAAETAANSPTACYGPYYQPFMEQGK